MSYYLDTSAFMKLIVSEENSVPMRRWVRARSDDLFSSDLLRTEALRAARRISPKVLLATRPLLDGLALVPLDRGVCDLAATLDPTILRSLDVLHLAAAMTLGDELDGLVTYDERLGHAAAQHGVEAIAPV